MREYVGPHFRQRKGRLGRRNREEEPQTYCEGEESVKDLICTVQKPIDEGINIDRKIYQFRHQLVASHDARGSAGRLYNIVQGLILKFLMYPS